MAEGVVILEPGDERAKKIAKAMSSGTATEILNLLKEGKRTSTEVAEQLQIPMTTVQYHLENLSEAGLIEVVEKRWSVKGREVKVYGLRDREGERGGAGGGRLRHSGREGRRHAPAGPGRRGGPRKDRRGARRCEAAHRDEAPWLKAS